VAGVEPAVVGVAETVEFTDVDHATDLGPFGIPSSVTHVTGGAGIPTPGVAKVVTSRARAREGLSDVSDLSRQRCRHGF